MKKIILLVTILILLGCEKSTTPDTTPPTVTITNPQNGSIVFEYVTINCVATDNKEVSYVELWIDGISTNIFDESEPYSLIWNTTIYEDGSSHTITIRAYDSSDNITDSEPISLYINNSAAYPNPINIISINYTLSEMTITWNKSIDNDFALYCLLISDSEIGIQNSIAEISSINDTVYILNEFNPTTPKWYWISVTDTLGYSRIGNSYYVLDENPTPVELYPVNFENNSFYFSWSQNFDDDFQSYTLYESDFPDMSNYVEISTIEEFSDTSFVLSGISNSEIKYYQIIVKDYFELESISNIQEGNSYITFTKTFGGSLRDIANSVQQTLDGGYIIAGYTESFGNGNEDFWLIKTDSQGNEEWNQTFGGNDTDVCLSMQQTTDGGYIMIGYTWSFGYDESDIWLLKADSQGNEEWNQTFGGYSQNIGYSVQQTFDSGFILTGRHRIEGHSYEDLWVIKTDSQGNELWNQSYSGNQGGSCGYSIKQTLDGGYIILGKDQSYPLYKIWLIKTDSQGYIQWDQLFGDSWHDYGYSIQETNDSGFIIAGVLDSDFWCAKTDLQGNIEWNFSDGGGEANSIQQVNDLGYIAVGYQYNDISMKKFDSQGIVEWEQSFNTNSDDWSGCSVQQTSDNGYIISGCTEALGNGEEDFIIIKTDINGNTTSFRD